jgi:flagellar basal-body rod protein FlgB
MRNWSFNKDGRYTFIELARRPGVLSLIDSNTSGLLGLALEAATLRQQAISHNIANAGAPGYRAVAVSFEERLAQARDALAEGRSVPPSALDDARPRLEFAAPGLSTGPGTELSAGLGADGAVSLDMQLAQLSENALHHQALLKALNRHYSILGSAINEGKR